MLTITWENTPKVKSYILSLMDKAKNKHGIIIGKNNKQPVIDIDGQELSFESFGMVAKGSEVYVKDNIVSIANYLNKHHSPHS